MLRMLLFIVVAKFNYTIFMTGYFYLVIHQIKLNQSEHDLAGLKNACANITEVWFMSPWGSSCGVLTHYCPTAVCLVDLLEITTPFSVLWSSWFTCWWIAQTHLGWWGEVWNISCCISCAASKEMQSKPGSQSPKLLCLYSMCSAAQSSRRVGRKWRSV